MGAPEIYVVDAFCGPGAKGNPAGVCLLDGAADAAWMAEVAAQMRHSETAFVWPDAADADFQLKWFTPKVEVPLCGHATLATAHVLFRHKHWSARDLRLQTLSGMLTVRQEDSGAYELSLPRRRYEPVDLPAEVRAALGSVEVLESFLVLSPPREEPNYLVRLRNEASVAGLEPDLGALRRPGGPSIIVTAEAADDDGTDFVSRYFAPGVGIDEDPVTGSAHCALGPYWEGVLGRSMLDARQLSARGGVLMLEVQDERVAVAGFARTFLSGVLSPDYSAGAA